MNELLMRLVSLYRQEKIRYPKLKEVTLAQWILESRSASSKLAKDHYNFGGLKWRPEMALYATKIPYISHGGEDYYCKFPTIESFINGYWAFLNRSPYSGWEGHTKSSDDFINFVGPIYSPSHGYAKKVLALLPEAKILLESFDEQQISTANSDFPDLGTIVIDPGHGGTRIVGGSSPNNAISFSGVKEKKLTLDFCMILREALEQKAKRKKKRINVVLTRTGDVNIGITARANFAITHAADLFLCLHFNGNKDTRIRGVETFYRDQRYGNINLEDDIGFATIVNESLFRSLRGLGTGAENRGVKSDHIALGKSLGVMNDSSLGNHGRTNKCRSCYIELEFITNPTVDKLLVSGADALKNRKFISDSLADAIVEYLEM